MFVYLNTSKYLNDFKKINVKEILQFNLLFLFTQFLDRNCVIFIYIYKLMYLYKRKKNIEDDIKKLIILKQFL